MRGLFWICLLPTVFASFDLNLQGDKNAYGPYNVRFLKYESCETSHETTLSELGLYGNRFIMNLTVINPCVLSKTKSRITVKSMQGDTKKTIFNYNLKDPCQHFLIAPLLKELLKIQKNCMIEKGNYYLDLDSNNLVNLYFGSNFFYGLFEFKSVIRCNTGYFVCVLSNVEFTKKTNL